MTTQTLAPTTEQLEQFERDGYFLLENLVSPAECHALKERLMEYSRAEREAPDGLRIEMEPRIARGELPMPSDRSNAVRALKGLVPRDDLFTDLALTPTLVAALQGVMGPDIKLFRDSILMKPAGIGSAKGVHQDAPYFPIEPMNYASCWIAFDDATMENGCMMVAPGSHKRGAIPHVETTDDYVIEAQHVDASTLVPVEMKAGTGLVFHSLLVHGTAPNTSPRPRRAITLIYMPSSSRYVRINTKGSDHGPQPSYFRISGEDVPGGV